MTRFRRQTEIIPFHILEDSRSGIRQYIGIQFFGKVGSQYPVYWFKSKIPMTIKNGDIILVPDRNNEPIEVYVEKTYQLDDWKSMPLQLYSRQRRVLKKYTISFVRRSNTFPKKGYKQALPKL